MLSRRGLFGALTGLAVTPVALKAEAVENTERARVQWFNHERGIGKLVGIESGREIWVRDVTMRPERLRPAQEVTVAWELGRSGYQAYAVWPT